MLGPRLPVRLLVRASVLLLVLHAAAGGAASGVTVRASATVGEATTLTVEVQNTGKDPVWAVVPEVVYQGVEVRAERAAALAPGAKDTWNFALPAPREPGTIPAAIRVPYTDGSGAHSLPAVAAVSTPGLLGESGVDATLTVSAATGFAQAQLVLENRTGAPIHGRVVALLPAGLETADQPGRPDVPAHGRRAVTLVLQTAADAAPAPAPMVALFEYGTDGRRHLAVASAGVAIGDETAVRPLAVSARRARAALMLLAIAWRRAPPRAAILEPNFSIRTPKGKPRPPIQGHARRPRRETGTAPHDRVRQPGQVSGSQLEWGRDCTSGTFRTRPAKSSCGPSSRRVVARSRRSRS